MRQKNDIEVLIGGSKYTISGYESSEYIMKIATYINDKLSAIIKNTDPRMLDNEVKSVLLQINIADDYHKQMARTAAITEEKNEADKALFELKHEMMTLQEQFDKLSEQNKQLKEDNSAKKKVAEIQEQLEEEKRKAAEALEQLEQEKSKAAEALEQLEQEKSKAAEALEQLEQEKSKAADALEQLEQEKKKTADALEKYEIEKGKYEELESTVDELLGGTDI